MRRIGNTGIVYLGTGVLLFLYTLYVSSCGNTTNTPTQGKQRIVIDESYSQLFDAEIDVFESLYKQSNLDEVYKPESEVIADLMNDSCRLVVLNRELTKKELDYFKSKNAFPTTTRIGVDALAFITHKDNPVTELMQNELLNIFSGKISSWKHLSSSIKEKSAQDTTLTIVFDNEGSGNVRLLKDSLLNGGPFPGNCFAVKSNPEVVDYVSKHKEALGIIGVNWISDADDTLTRSFLKKVNVLGIEGNAGDGSFFQPYQAHVYTGEYPFCRNIYIINNEGRTGLGTGFAAFVAGDKGQLIILKAGLVPATQPVRMVTITN